MTDAPGARFFGAARAAVGSVLDKFRGVFKGAHADSAFDELVQLRCDAKLDAYADGVLRGMARVSLADADAVEWRLYEAEVARWCEGNGMQVTYLAPRSIGIENIVLNK